MKHKNQHILGLDHVINPNIGMRFQWREMLKKEKTEQKPPPCLNPTKVIRKAPNLAAPVFPPHTPTRTVNLVF